MIFVVLALAAVPVVLAASFQELLHAPWWVWLLAAPVAAGAALQGWTPRR